ncbi:MAG: hypothetical protein K2G87_07350 [Oscillospiraceae bacterium]|nr:hypothetical protein [Oscillospiraceae bacterium]
MVYAENYEIMLRRRITRGECHPPEDNYDMLLPCIAASKDGIVQFS